MEIEETATNAQIIERKSSDTASCVIVIDADETPTTSNKKDEVVVLDDEEDVIIDLVGKKSCNTKCINYACNSGEEMLEAPGLCLQYFRVKNTTENKRREVCKECYMMAMEHYDALATALVKKDNIFDVKFPLRNDMFEIDDSDEEDEDEGVVGFNEDCVAFLNEEFTKVLEDTLNKYELNKQVEDGIKYLKERSKPLEEDFKKVDDELKCLRKKLDSVQLNLYRQFPIKIKEEMPIEIIADSGMVVQQKKAKVEPERRSLRNAAKKMNYSEESFSVVDKEKVIDDVAPPIDLPPTGELVREPLIIGECYYASRLASRGSWIKVKLLDVLKEEQHTLYKVCMIDKVNNHYFVNGKELAYTTPAKVRLEVGTRVIAKFVFNNSVVTTGVTNKKDSYYPGIIGESLCAANKYRYLVFFDDGYAQYVEHKNVFVTLHTSETVWEDINEQNKDFIKKYLESYPDRSMVKLMKRQTLEVEYNGRKRLSNHYYLYSLFCCVFFF